MRAFLRSGSGAAAAAAAVVLTASCAATPSDAGERTTGADRLTAGRIRSCLDKHPGNQDGLLFRTTTRSSESFVGVIMMDLTTRPTRTATVGIAIYDDADLLDAYEERARQDPTDEVTRFKNAVVSLHTPTSERLALGERWVQGCLRER